MENLGLFYIFDSEVIIVERGKSANHVLLEPTRRLLGDFDSVLQQTHWEGRRWHGRQPHAEILVTVVILSAFVLSDTLKALLDYGQEGWTQVAVLQDDPHTFFDAHFHAFSADVLLALPQTHSLHTVAHSLIIGKLVHL